MMKPMSKFMQAGQEQWRVLSQDDHEGLNWMNWMFDKNSNDELTIDQ